MSFSRLGLGLLGLISFFMGFWTEEPLLHAGLQVLGVVACYTVFYLRRHWALYAAAYGLSGVAVGLFTLGRHPLVVFAGWEGVSMAAWLLIAFRDGWSDRGLGAAQISFLVNRVGDAFWLGALLSGSWNWGYVLGGWVKAALFPATFWLIQAMWGVAPTSALLHSALLVALGVYGPLKHGDWLRDLPLEVICQAAEVSALACSFGALLSRSPKATLAWTTAVHLSLAAGHWGQPSLGMQALLSHAYYKAALFLLLGVVQKRLAWTLGYQALWLSIAGLLLLSSPHEQVGIGYGAELLSAFALGRLVRAYPLVGRWPESWGVFSGALAGLGLYERQGLYLDGLHLVLVGMLGVGIISQWPRASYRIDKWFLGISGLAMTGWMRLSAILAQHEAMSLVWQERGMRSFWRVMRLLASWEGQAIDRVWRPLMAWGGAVLSRFVYGTKGPGHYQGSLRWALLISLLFLGLWRYLS